jgi:hypothetical protein
LGGPTPGVFRNSREIRRAEQVVRRLFFGRVLVDRCRIRRHKIAELQPVVKQYKHLLHPKLNSSTNHIVVTRIRSKIRRLICPIKGRCFPHWYAVAWLLRAYYEVLQHVSRDTGARRYKKSKESSCRAALCRLFCSQLHPPPVHKLLRTKWPKRARVSHLSRAWSGETDDSDACVATQSQDSTCVFRDVIK